MKKRASRSTPNALAHRLHDFRALATGLAGEGKAAQREVEKGVDLRELGKARGRGPHALGVELQHDVASGDHFAGRGRGNPVVRQIAPDDREMPRLERLDVVADERHADAFAHEMDFVFRVDVPDVARPRIIVEAPQEALADIRDNMLDDRRLAGARPSRSPGSPSPAHVQTAPVG